jgi:hypothetical protein
VGIGERIGEQTQQLRVVLDPVDLPFELRAPQPDLTAGERHLLARRGQADHPRGDHRGVRVVPGRVHPEGSERERVVVPPHRTGEQQGEGDEGRGQPEEPPARRQPEHRRVRHRIRGGRRRHRGRVRAYGGAFSPRREKGPRVVSDRERQGKLRMSDVLVRIAG